MQWQNAPKTWKQSGTSFIEEVPAGNSAMKHVAAILKLRVRISGKYHELYHPAGLMIRIDEKNWIKTDIEFVSGHQNVSAVVTRDLSDWSVLSRNDNPSSIWMRLQRFNDTVQVSYSLDGISGR